MRLFMQAAPSFISRFLIHLSCLFLAGFSSFGLAPNVTIVSPVHNGLFIVPVNGSTNVTVKIDASSPDRRIKRVEVIVHKLYIDFASFALTNTPYTVVLSNLSENSYHVRAIAVDDLGVSSATVMNGFRVGRYVTNDLFADRALLTGEIVRIIARTDGATLEVGEPYPPIGSQHTVWWRWVAPSSGYYDLTTTASEIEAFTGSDFSSLKIATRLYPLFLRNDYSFRRLAAQAGTEYVIRAGTGAYIGPPPLEIGLAIAPAPTLTLTSPLPDEVFHGTSESPALVEFSVAPLPPPREITAVHFSVLDGTIMDYELRWPVVGGLSISQAPFAGALTNLSPGNYVVFAQASDDYGVAARAELRPFTVKDDTVLNDDFANSFLAQGTFLRLSATNLHRATTEPGESTVSPLGSVWWHWTAPVTARYAICNFGSYLTFSVYTGDSLSALSPVVGTSYFPAYFDATAGVTYHLRMLGYHSIKERADIQIIPAPEVSITSPQVDAVFPRGGNIRFQASAISPQLKIVRAEFSISNSTTVLIRGTSTVAPYHFTWTNVPASSTSYTVAASAYDKIGLSTTSAPVRFSVSALPINDDFSAAINLSGVMVQGAASAVGATSEPGEPDPVSSQTLWWNWTTPTGGDFEVTLLGNFASALHIFRDVTAGALIQAAALTNNYPTSISRILILHANPGETYRIRMSPYPSNASETRPLTFQIRPAGDLPAPTVRITAPQDEQLFIVGSNVPIHVEATADYPVLDEGFIDQAYVATVQFFANDQRLGSIVADSRHSDFTLIWTNRQSGRFLLTAKAGDQTRGFTTSDAVAVTFTLPQQIELRLVEIGANQFRFAIVGPTDNTYSVSASTDLVTWSLVATNLTSSSSIAEFFELTAHSSAQTFYKATVP
jgi:hypothetical protein